MDIVYRNARHEDCPVLAEFINLASDGFLDYLFKDAIPDLTVTQLLAFGLEDEQRHGSYKEAVVAQYEDKVIGMIQSYSSVHHRIDEEMRSFIPGERLDRLEEFYASRIDNSLLVNAMYVDDQFRRQGIGSRLIEMARKKARAMGFDGLSLFVFSDNEPARNLYSSSGFADIKEIAFIDSARINHQGGIILMACSV